MVGAPMPLAEIDPKDLFQLWKDLVAGHPEAFIIAGVVSVAAYVGLILVPAVESYGRAWEKLAAGFLSLFMLATFVVIGIGLSLIVLYNYDTLREALP
jgi:hypothetical protein